MKRALTFFVLLVTLAPELCAATKMWGCAPPGQRRNAIVLVDRGAQSYVKISGQRVTAQLTAKDADQRWAWGTNSVVLTDETVAQYYEGDVVKAKLKCKRLGGD